MAAITQAQARAAVKAAKGNKNAAARALGVSERVIRYWLEAPDAAAEPRDPVAVREAAQAARVERHSVAALVEEVRTLREQMRAQRALTALPLAPIKRVELTSGLRECVAVANVSDLHVEERVAPHETPTGNAYNLAIADLRLGRLFAGIEWQVHNARQWARVDTLVLNLNGDLMSGHIHDELKETTQLSPIKTIQWLHPRILGGIVRLARVVERIDVVCCFGNHGRDTLKIRHATGADHSYEWGLYQRLADDLRNLGEKGVSVHAPEAQHAYHQAFDWDLHFHHGDAVNYGGGVGGIMIPINKATDSWQVARRCHYHFYGHWHQYIPGAITVNGSLIGYNAFAMRVKARPEPAQQAFCLIDSKRGMTAMSPIWVSDASAERDLWEAA